ncbi:FAD-binding oxidoreductase [Streptomyces caatingaensis]|uniref:FAD-binding PCMH-type domain-containing protein n=1 Tax=Streptomyces caatingaensis TaxID=1678637 RepID=A0A0K9XFM2_9ACTN|nr:FAD-binding oxidoreductase [Streptomyces caatingaensis]KNB52170.1 hypothetical protein AC230_11450 [Streptomyces caatingaensis]
MTARPTAEDRTAPAGDLPAAVRGEVLTPGDAGFDAGRAGFQTAARHRPALLVRAAGPDDVAAAVAHAAARSLPIAVQATGHGLSVPADGGVLIDTSALRGVRVDPVARTARVAAGTPFADVVDAAARYGLAPLNGSSPGVGAVGYALGGGLPLLGRRFGHAADHVRAVELVTPDGRPRRVTADSDPELFRGLRGAGANFGVVTALETGLVPVTRIHGGELVFDLARTPDLMDVYRRWTRTLPEELTSSVALTVHPDLPALPPRLRGRHLAQVRIACTAEPAVAEALVAPLRALGPLSDGVAEMPYTECGTIYHDPPRPHAYLGDNVLVRDFDGACAEAATRLAGPASPAPCVLEVRHLGGALARPPAAPDAVGHRAAGYLVRVLTPLALADERDAADLHRTVLDVFARERLGRCPNLVYGGWTRDAGEAPATDFWEPADHRRLAALKSRTDPDNLLRFNRNILPLRER